ncbi:MAG TPA: PilZ domain-containing protein [Candidatus Sulfotelmatobacter sp.]|nr:PilZ domain-containing protein [Candidatus Sulfotelmatobacter sp.]
MTVVQENRRSRRIQVQGDVDATGTPTFQASVVNLSRDGVCVEHAAKLEPGQVCELRFRIPPMSFSVRARVVWSSPHRQGGGTGRFRSGAEFVDVSEDARAAIDVIVARPPA